MLDALFSEALPWQQQRHNIATFVIMTTNLYAHYTARVAVNRAVQFVLFAMLGAYVLYRYNRTG
jgi:hypothetical protein